VPGRGITRQGFLYRARPGHGAAMTRLFADLDRAAAADPDQPLASSTMYLRDDLLVRVIDRCDSDRETSADPVASVDPAKLSLLLDPGQDGDLTTRSGIRDYLAGRAMAVITDRRSHD
jgi:hypothetical protein